MENEHESFKRYNKQNPFSAGVDKLEIAERKIHRYGYVVREICQTENSFTLHLRRDCEDSR